MKQDVWKNIDFPLEISILFNGVVIKIAGLVQLTEIWQ